MVIININGNNALIASLSFLAGVLTLQLVDLVYVDFVGRQAANRVLQSAGDDTHVDITALGLTSKYLDAALSRRSRRVVRCAERRSSSGEVPQ